MIFVLKVLKVFGMLGLLSGLLLTTATAAEPPRILVLGDSLSAAYGIPLQQGWVALLQQRLAAQGYPHRVINASISGDTTQGGLARLPAALRAHRPSLVLIELGANDGLRGLPVKTLRGNLEKMIGMARKAGARSLVFEMLLPFNYGDTYRESFTRSFAEVSSAENATLVPFFLRDFATNTGAFLDDGIHPSVASQPRMLDAVWPVLKPLLGHRKASGGAKKP